MGKIDIINVISLFNIFFIASYVQISKQDSPIHNLRKLIEITNETVLLGFDNYNSNNDNNYIYFDIYFYLKNWTLDNIEYLSLNEDTFTINTEINYEKNTEAKNLTCINNNEWFINNFYSAENKNCFEMGYCFARYTCELNINENGNPTKINITNNFKNLKLSKANISYVSSSADYLKNDLLSLNYQTKSFEPLKNASFESLSQNSFKIRGEGNDVNSSLNSSFNSDNIYLMTTVNGSPKKILCSGQYTQDDSSKGGYYTIATTGSDNLVGADLQYALLNYTKEQQGHMVLLDFKDGNGIISGPKIESQRRSKSLSTGAIIGIVIPCCVVLIGVTIFSIFFARRSLPPPPQQPNKIDVNTMGSQTVIKQ